VEDERTKLRRLSQEALDALRGEGEVSPRAWELFHLVLTRLLRLELGSFTPEETPTSPDRRFTSTEQGISSRTTPPTMDAVLPPILNPKISKRFQSTEKWTANAVKELFDKAKGENEK
jgi:hypothetical protein